MLLFKVFLPKTLQNNSCCTKRDFCSIVYRLREQSHTQRPLISVVLIFIIVANCNFILVLKLLGARVCELLTKLPTK